jgi:predicted enzyme related to lactoylglutathione lyase
MCINITASDPAALVEFYTEVMGVPLLEEGFGSYDGAQLGFLKGAPSICIWDNKWGQYGKPTLVFKCDSLDRTYEELKLKGLEIDPPFTAYWGGRGLTLNDPDGNIILLLEE